VLTFAIAILLPLSTASLVVAVDGPAAAGKGTISKQLAAKLNLAHMDTGA